MVRTQIQLSEDQIRELKAQAAAEGVSVAELIRRAVDKSLQDRLKPSREELIKRAAEVIGSIRSGDSDVSERHDDYLAEAYKDW